MSYDDHLDHALEETPDIQEGGERFKLPEPEVRQEGNVSVFENFQGTLDRLDREANHVMKFVQNELGTSASVDERGRLRLTGDFRQRRVADAIDAYADAYVRCPECGLPDTKIVTENGAELLQCQACGARSATGG
ncbi:translation initiation factor IF-2 subunit beta [Halorientalis sp.]|uniref:translation initiation factor IF-2 subunit beta n=1 Tax=Halorientalis sp. TaxID=1931229 RepID=UPI0026155731|nr:translation initiation factor IF-2 subunit beta [Halorientalis sp.]